MNQTSLRIDDYLRQVESLCVQLSYSSFTRGILGKEYNGNPARNMSYVEDKSNAFQYYYGFSNIISGIDSIFVYNANGYPYYYSRMLVNPELNAHSKPWFPEMNDIRDPGYVQFSTIHIPDEFNYVTTKYVVSLRRNIRRILVPVAYPWDGCAEIQLLPNAFGKIIQRGNISTGEKRRFSLLDQLGNVIYSTASNYETGQPFRSDVIETMVEQENPSGNWIADGDLISYSRSGYSGWYLVGETDEDMLYQNIYVAIRLFLFTFLFSLVLIVFVGFVVSRGISKPLRILKRRINDIQKGDFDSTVPLTGNDEFGQLAKSFDHMSKELKSSIERIYKTEEQKRVAEITAMQAQINPHFTLNTLNTIKYIALLQNSDNIANMLDDFILLIRSVLKDPLKLIPLRDELDRVRAFIRIQDISSFGKVRVELDYPDSVLEYRTISLILQPIIENAVFHGIKPKMESHQQRAGNIAINVSESDGCIHIHVIDDGVGIPKEDIPGLLSGEKSGIGLYNVNQRIKLRFGEEYGIRIDSDIGQGCDVLIVFPKIEKGED